MTTLEHKTLGRAMAFAANAHTYQVDKQGEAYILHPMRMVLAMREKGYPETFQVVAALHDTVEDTEVTLEDIYKQFGPVVCDAVDAMTKRLNPDTGEKLETYKQFIARCCMNLVARNVKRFDIYDNMDPKRFCADAPYERYVWALKFIEDYRE